MKTILAFLVLTAAIAIAGCGNKESAKPAEEITTASGLKYKDTKAGSGEAVVSGNMVTVDYNGWLDNGTVFDTSKRPGGKPFSFTVGAGGGIKGWDEGLVGMKVGGVRELTIPPSLGYGDEDKPQIPPNSTLHFEVTLLKIGG